MRWVLVSTVAGYVTATGVLVAFGPTGTIVWPFAIMTALFSAAVWTLSRAHLTPRVTAAIVLGVGTLLQLLMLVRAPLTSDDANRYVWDAKVQLSGIDPYRYAPQAPQLVHLRQGDLFGPTSSCAHPVPGSCTAINRPAVRTIYPPVAQVAFDAGRLLSFGGRGGVFVYQVLGAIGALVVAVLLLRRRLARDQGIWQVALWAWCPIVLSEFGNNAHLDWLAVALTLLAFQTAAAHRSRWTGFLVGAAILTKLYPALVLPALLRKRPWLVGMTAVGTVALSYVPHVLAVGGQVIGYLPGYLHEEGYESGNRLLLLGVLLPHPIDTAVGLIIIGCAAWWAWRRTDVAPEHAAVTVVGVAFLVTTPAYGWYAGLLLALAVVARRYEWLPVAFAPSVVYLVHGHRLEVTAYAVAFGAMLVLRRARIRSGTTTSEPRARLVTNV